MKMRLCLFSVIICLFSCEKYPLDSDLTVGEFYQYTTVPIVECGTPVHHEGEEIAITGYISSVNYFPEECRFFLYEEPQIEGMEVQVTGIEDQDEIVEKLDKYMEENPEGFIRLRINATIVGHDFFTETCRRGALLEINNARDIRALD